MTPRPMLSILLFVALCATVPGLRAQEDADLDLAAIAQRQAEPATLRLHDGRQGEALFRAAGDGRCRVVLRCSTRSGARLRVEALDDAGRTLQNMVWTRGDDRDPSPLQVNGDERPDSMFERSPGDFSPRATEESFDVEKGMEIRLSLSNAGGGTPELLFSCDAPGRFTEAPDGDDGEDDGAGGSDGADLEIDPGESWTLDVEGRVTSTSGFARLVHGEGSVHGRVLDVFTNHGSGLNVRLANKAISFTRARVGGVHNPGADSDHWFRCAVGKIRKGEDVKLRIENDASSKRMRVWWQGELAGDVDYEVRRSPGKSRGLVFENLEGTATLTKR